MSDRVLKVQEQIRRLLAQLLLREGNFGVGMVSINDILVSRDLSTAKILVSFIAEKDQPAAFKRLLRHAHKLQTHLYKNLPVKKVPKIIWLLDGQPDATYQIEKLLDDISSTPHSHRDLPESGDNSPEDSDRLAS